MKLNNIFVMSQVNMRHNSWHELLPVAMGVNDGKEEKGAGEEGLVERQVGRGNMTSGPAREVHGLLCTPFPLLSSPSSYSCLLFTPNYQLARYKLIFVSPGLSATWKFVDEYLPANFKFHLTNTQDKWQNFNFSICGS